MESEDNKDTDNGSPTEQQGIFSTPELTVATENLPDPETEPSEDDKARIAAAFQGTDASRAQAAREMNVAALAASAIPSTATDDIRLPGEKKKLKKAPIVISLVIIILLGAGGGIWWLLEQNGSKTQPITVKEAFMSYKDYLEKGPENLRGDSQDSSQDSDGANSYFLFAISNNNIVSENDVSAYLKELANKYNVFTASLGKQTESLGDVNLDQYGRMLSLFINSASLRDLRQSMLNRYLDTGANSAYNYISEVIPKQPDNEDYYAIKKVNNALEAYLNDELNLIKIYQELGCISDHVVNTACGDEEGYTNSVFMELRAKQASQQEIIISYGEVLQPIFREQTDKLSTAIMETKRND